MKRRIGLGAVLLGMVLASTFALHIFAQKPEGGDGEFLKFLSRTSIFSWEQEYMETEYEPQYLTHFLTSLYSVSSPINFRTGFK